MTQTLRQKSLRFVYCAFAVAYLFSAGAVQAAADDFVELPRDLEIKLALSALPEALQEGAAIYVRDSKEGFVLHREGTNGFATFVVRTSVRFYEADWPYTYPRDQLIPIAYDRVGTRHHMKPFIDIERMRTVGVSPEEAKRQLRKRFKDGTYTAPTKGGMSYMLAPILRAYAAPAQSSEVVTYSNPHYMSYAPYVVTKDLGQMDPHYRAGTLDHGGRNTGPHGYLYFMVQQDQVDAIRAKHADLLDRLCALNTNWCLPNSPPAHDEKR